MIHYTKFISKNRSAEWITFVHGAGGSSTIWYKQIKYFSNKYNLLLLDLRGHGKSKSIPINPFKKISLIEGFFSIVVRKKFFSLS